MKDTPMPPALTDLYYINDTNLDLRKKFITLTPDDVNVLRQLAGWAERHADAIAREFYDHQFAFAPTEAFFEGQARRKGLSLADLRQHLEKSQAGYFRQIFQEAVQGGRYGTDYFAKRLKVGKLHNIINLPLKWYVGSYALYQDLVRRYLRRAYFFRPGFRAKAERAIFTVFNYDMQAVSDAFFYDYLQSIGLDLSHVAIASREHDLSENYAALKEAVRTALEETVRTSVHLAEASAQLAANAAQTGEATSQITQTIQQVAMGITQQTASVSTTANSMEQMQRAIDGVARGAQEQARAIGQASNVVSRMSTAVDSIRHGAEAQADGAQRAEAMQALLAQSLRQVNDLAGQVSTQSEQSVTTAEEGARLAEANVSGIRRVFSTTEQLAQRVRDLGRRSGQIGAIVETITDIAAQTNLLALNAAIEAARAGEHGAGFAVVADEVRKLAERAAGATKEIAEMVQLIQSGATEVSETMGAVGVEVSNSVKHTEETGTAFQAIASGARGVSEQLQAARAAITAMDTGNHKLEQVVTEVKQIAERNRVSAQEMAVLNSQAVESLDGVSAVVEENTAATEQMAASATEVTQSVESIASVSEENSAAVEQVSASTEEMSAQVQEVSTSAQTLNEIAQKLQTVVAQFQLGEITAAPVSGPVAVPAAPRRMNGNGRSREKIPARPY